MGPVTEAGNRIAPVSAPRWETDMTETSDSAAATNVRRGDPCTIKDCGKPVVGRGWCAKHYATWQKYSDPFHETRRYVRQSARCAHQGCDEKPKRRGYCEKHVRRQIKHGETTDPRERRFWAQIDRRGPEECWPWLGYVHPKTGYGQFGARAGTRLPHRVAYEYVNGLIPDGLVLDHLCHTLDVDCASTNECPHRRCCNPEHLEPVTRRENIARGRGGDSWGYVPEEAPARPHVEKSAVCAQCQRPDKPVYKRGLCRPCYRCWLKDPAVERPSQRTPEQRFWAKVEKTPTCWLWVASINSKTGYGQFSRRHGEPVDAHRFAYELTHGPVPKNHDVHHVCHRRRCVNPAHLEAVTRSANLRLRKDRRA
jgi:hypothetical protein